MIVPLAAAAIVATAGLTWSLAEARAYTVRHVRVPVLDPGTPSVRILHLADLHATGHQRKKLDWLRGLGRLDVDAVINTGDNLAHVDAVPAVVDALGPLLDVPGAYVYGSNDYFAPRPKNPLAYFRRPSRVSGAEVRLPTQDLTDAFTNAGWINLNNRRGELVLKGVTFSLVGMDDPHIGADRMPDKDGAIAGDVHLGVVHAPYHRALEALSSDGARLVLAGHTHGGQVCLPGWGALVTNCDLPTAQAKGLHRWDVAHHKNPTSDDAPWLHVSAGVGTSPYAPVRLACRPEATVLELVARS